VVKLQALSSIAWGFLSSSSVRKSLRAWPFLRSVGAKIGAMLLALKSGNFGGRSFFADALKLMRRSF
jgi:uncharacterized protein YgbK (DUF1537 family)